MNSHFLVRVVVALATLSPAAVAFATPITISRTYQFLDNVSTNSLGIGPGLRQQFGSNCVVLVGNACTPQSVANAQGTTVTGTQGASFFNLGYVASDLTSNHWALARLEPVLPDGAWTLTAANGTDTGSATTPTLAGAVTIGFGRGMSMTQNGLAPTFAWELPTPQPGGSIDSITMVIRDVTDVRNGVATIIYARSIAAAATSWQVLPTDPRFVAGKSLQFGQQYALELQLQDTRDNLSGGGFPNVLSQSRTHVNFTLDTNAPAGAIYLPALDRSGPVPVFRFYEVPVVAGQTVLIDPEIAVGFDYQIGAGDPLFRSVTLQTGIGDDLFDLWLWDGSAWYDTLVDLQGGVEYLFGGNGVDRFRVLGIETSAALDPFNAGTFTTGVSFMADGRFNGTMTPIIVNQAPVAPTLLLVALTLPLLRLGRR